MLRIREQFGRDGEPPTGVPNLPVMTAITAGPGAFGIDDLRGLEACYREHGFAVLSGAVDAPAMDRLEAECVAAQEQLVAGRLAERHGTTVLIGICLAHFRSR